MLAVSSIKNASCPPKYILQSMKRFSVNTSKICLALECDPEYTTFLKDLS
jgi:hypothetical protein